MRIAIYFLAAIFIMIGCSSSDQNLDVKVFHYNQPNRITSLDPAFAKSQNNMWSIHHIFSTLVELDSNLKLKPNLAKSWSISDDGLNYTFDLRTDVLFHKNECFSSEDERRLTAQDVAYSFNRIISTEVNSPGSWIFIDKVAENEPFKALNDSTFVMTLQKPFLPMLNILSMQYCSVVSQKAIDFYGNQTRTNPVGTGPFRFKRWIESQGLFLIRNDRFFQSTIENPIPFLDGVRTSFMEDKKIAFLELLNKKVECVSGLESSFINELLDENGNLRADKQKRINLYKSPFLNFEYLGLNQENISTNIALSDKRVRQALNYAVDRETMMQSLRNNIGFPANSGVIPRGLPSYDSKKVPGYTYDMEKARKLLTAAGFSDGVGVPEIVLNTNKDYLDITTFVAKQWEKLGLKIKISLLESASLREGMRNGNLDIFRASWIADYPDGESFLCLFYSGYPAPPNYTHFKNDAFDTLYEKAINETDLERRTELYHEMNRIVVEEAPVIFLFYDESALFTTKNISEVETNALNLLQVKSLKEE